MSHHQHLTTAQQPLEVGLDAKPKIRRTKSKTKKSKSKKQNRDNILSDSVEQAEIDKRSNPGQNATKIRDDNFHNTVTKPNGSCGTYRKTANVHSVQKQVKLNFFLRKRAQNSNTDSTSLNNCSSKYAIPEYQRRQASLEKQLSEKQAYIERLKTQKQANLQKYTRLKMQSEENKIVNKRVLQEQLRESSKLKRQEKAQINPNMGYYKQTTWTVFVQGDYILNAKRKVQSLTNNIKELQQKKRNSRQEQRQRLSYQIDYLSKQRNQASTNLRNRQVQLTTYKQRLRLADKQSNCSLAKSNWPLINNRYLPLQLLGSGGFGQVYKCYDLDGNNYVALKTNCFQPTKCQQNREQFIKHVERQINTLKSLNHPNIAKLIDEILIDHKISFILQYCTGPQLSKYLVKRQYLDEKQAKGVIKQLSFALKYMFQQKNRIIHYDMKPANIIFHNGCVKILDFGLCKRMETQDTKIDLTSQGVGTYWYLPPETFKQFAQISSKVDVWSLGVIFYELLFGKRPFGHGINQNKIYQEGIILKAIKVQFPPDKKFKVSEQAKQFIKQCLKYDPQERLDPLQLYEHPYLNQ